MGLIKEFKQFAMRGNLVDMAVAVVIGASFNKVVSAFIDGMVMPLIGKLFLEIDLSKVKYILQHEVKDGDKIITPEVAIQVGGFMTQIIDFTIVAFALFLLVKAMNRIRKTESTSATKTEILLTEIRDSIKEKK
ncbi:MAG: large conductance mechanosensitive channel protein MscL [Bacteroidetes bacterium]|nr:large conductance mechanosensitive channel protein MscL [Bacteroidota bacterium]